MNQALKAKWVEALRSGQYQQARKKLKDEQTGAMCCLGVLREVITPGSVEKNDEDEYLPQRMRLSATLTWSQQNQLAQMNDGNRCSDIRQHSFAEIADWIEANL